MTIRNVKAFRRVWSVEPKPVGRKSRNHRAEIMKLAVFSQFLTNFGLMVKCHFGLLVLALRSSSIQNFIPHCILEWPLFRSSLRLLISTGPLNKARLNWGKSLEENSEFVEYCWPPLSCNPAPAPCRELAQPVEQQKHY